MNNYKHIFFDLDDTLWDYDKNSQETLEELYQNYRLYDSGDFTVEKFITQFKVRNTELWEKYKNGTVDVEILRKDRFVATLNDLGIKQKDLCTNIAIDYLKICPKKSNIIRFAHEVLAYLQKKYQLHILTNGFEETQCMKLEHSGLKKYFTNIITSERAGCRKPDKKIFEYALQKADAIAKECIMIGDDHETDILGAKGVGIKQIFFNPEVRINNYNPTYEIKDLSELYRIL
ncbi:MAG: noncanonical pyrimidine nucleotidase, YjjG family [Cytophagales bacterium]|nr:noncanonical pyrimidine nucleotidase, YjjG family [Cytophagales bacterium]